MTMAMFHIVSMKIVKQSVSFPMKMISYTIKFFHNYKILLGLKSLIL